MPSTRTSSHTDLRAAVDCLPQRTREAMLDGVRANPIIVGGYTDGAGGICPMLAAHRHGGRTDFVIFAKAWDAYTNPRRRRRATRHELHELIAMLETSLGVNPPPTQLAAAVSDHQTLARDRRAREAAGTGGWGFLRRFRSTPEPEESESATPIPLGEGADALSPV